jgi:hypothetical protein
MLESALDFAAWYALGFAGGFLLARRVRAPAPPAPEPATPPEPEPPVKANAPEFAAGVAVGYLAGLRGAEESPPDVVPFPAAPLKLADLDADE